MNINFGSILSKSHKNSTVSAFLGGISHLLGDFLPSIHTQKVDEWSQK
jgi:hypothetical protein